MHGSLNNNFTSHLYICSFTPTNKIFLSVLSPIWAVDCPLSDPPFSTARHRPRDATVAIPLTPTVTAFSLYHWPCESESESVCTHKLVATVHHHFEHCRLHLFLNALYVCYSNTTHTPLLPCSLNSSQLSSAQHHLFCFFFTDLQTGQH